MSFSVINHAWEQAVNGFDSRSQAEDKRKAALSSFSDISPDSIEVVQGDFEDYAEWQNSGHDDDVDPEIVDHSPDESEPEPPQEPQAAHVPENPDVTDDPVEWMPSHFVDDIQGVPTVNRKGYAVIASNYGVGVTAEPVVRASETGFEYAEFQATAVTEDGTAYSGYGSAHVDREDDKVLLNELAETRAMKRAVAWATGVGMTAIEEMKNTL